MSNIKTIQEGNLLDTGAIAKYERNYGEYIEIASEAMKKKYEYDWTGDDTVAFGRYCDNWEDYRPIMESDNTSRNTLGEALQSNLGLIAMAYSALPIQNFASVQPLNDEAGTVFFREGIAVNARGDILAGDKLISPLGAINKDIGSFTSETQVKTLVITDNTALSYGPFTLAPELKPNGVTLSVAGGKIKGMDDGEGHIIGVGIDADASTVNYATGAVTLVFTNLASKGVINSDVIDVTYRNSVIDSDTIPTMKWVLSSKVIKANYYILQSQYSNLSELVLRKRFGADLANQVSADLVSQIASSVMNEAISKMRKAAIMNETISGIAVSWPMAAPAGVSAYDHRKTFDDKLIEATGVMYAIAGKGDVSTLIVGTKGKQVLTTSGMRVIKNAVSGPHLCGMYADTPVYYAPNTVLGDNEILVIYRGANWYEAPMVYAPFLPLTTVSGSTTTNVFMNAQGAYHAAALENVMNGFVVRITMV